MPNFSHGALFLAALFQGQAARVVLSRYALLWTGVALLIVAWLVNWLVPAQRPRLRRVVILWVTQALARVAALGLAAIGMANWATYVSWMGNLAQAYTVVGLLAIAVFHLSLPALRINVVSITSDLVVGVLYVMTTAGVLTDAGVNTSSVVATSAVVSGILALSFQATLGNILGGVALQLDDSIHVGDWIQLENGRQGLVREIRWRHTVVETRDADTLIVPNAALLASNILILGKSETYSGIRKHRMSVAFNVDFRFPVAQVISAVQEALLAGPIPGVADSPQPNVVSLDFARDGRDSFAYYAARYYLTDLLHDDSTSSKVRERIYSGLQRGKIPLARPVTTTFLAREEDEQQKTLKRFERKLKCVKNIELFQTLTDEEQRTLAATLVRTPFSAGEIITRQGAPADCLYLLIGGSVEVSVLHPASGESRRVANFSAPNFFGEMGVVTGGVRTAQVRAVTDVETFRLLREPFAKLIGQREGIAAEISTTLAHRSVELIAVRDGLDAAGRRGHEASERARILERIQSFLGLDR